MLRFNSLASSNALRTFVFSGAVSFAALAGLSGCTQPVEVNTESVKTAAAKNLAFSYDTVIDQIAHMSCSNLPSATSYNKSAYFTYRAGAYTNGGIMLKDSFFDTLKNKKVEYQSEVLVASPANSGTILQMALRSRANYQSVYTASGTAALDQDYANMLTELGKEDISDTLIALPVGNRIRHLRTGNVGGARVEGSLFFNASESLIQGTRDFIQGRGGTSTNTGLLAITYTNGTATSARSIVDLDEKSTTTNARSVYGRGYIMTFAKPTVSGSIATSYPENVISLVQEQSLDSTTPVTAGNWSCPASMQFRIVRSEDINKSGANCRKITDPELMTPELRIVRNSLRSEDWYVDMQNRCIIPKKNSGKGCYGDVADIKYNLGDTCGATNAAGTASNCTQYASICYRTN